MQTSATQLWSDVQDEMVAAQLIFDFEDHVMAAGTPPEGVRSWLGATRDAFPDIHVPGESVRAEPTSRDAHR